MVKLFGLSACRLLLLGCMHAIPWDAFDKATCMCLLFLVIFGCMAAYSLALSRRILSIQFHRFTAVGDYKRFSSTGGLASPPPCPFGLTAELRFAS